MENEIISTLKTPGLRLYERQVGNSTKQIDFAIQALFEGKTVKCEDHARIDKMNKMLFDRILSRLLQEHRRYFNRIEKNAALLTIKLSIK